MSTDPGNTTDIANRVAQIEKTIEDTKRWLWIILGLFGITGIGSVLQLRSEVKRWADQAGLQVVKEELSTVKKDVDEKLKPDVSDMEKRVSTLGTSLDELLKRGPLIAKGNEKPISFEVAPDRDQEYSCEFPSVVKNTWYHVVDKSGTSQDYSITIKKDGKKVTLVVRNQSSFGLAGKGSRLKLKLELFASSS